MAEQRNDLETFAAFYTTCPRCDHEFVDPKCLPACAHSVCSGCVDKIRVSQTSECVALKCPVCGKESRVNTPHGSCVELPSNPVLTGLLAFLHRRNYKAKKLGLQTEPGEAQAKTSSGRRAEVESDLTKLRSERNRINNVLQEFRSGFEDELLTNSWGFKRIGLHKQRRGNNKRIS